MQALVVVAAVFVFVALPWPYEVAVSVGWLGGSVDRLVAFHRRGLERLERAGLRTSTD